MQSAIATTAHSRPAENFRAFYREHYGFVWHVVGRFGVAPAELGDAVQDTFVTAYRRHGGAGNTAPRSWLYGIARRVASNYRRGAGRAARKHGALASVGAPNVTPAVADALVVLDRFLEGQNDRDRELFVLSEVLGWSGQEIAETTRIEPRIVYARLRLLRRQLAEAAPEELLVSLSRVRSEPPRASDRGWIALLSGLREGGDVVAVVASSSLCAKIAGSVAVVGVAIGVVATLPTTDDPPQQPVAAILEAPVPSSSPEAAVTPVELAAPVVRESTPQAPAPRAATAPTKAVAPDTTLARDNAMLAEVLDAVTTDPSRALDLATAHTREFPNSPQADVRSALRIDALCLLGRKDEGRREADAFLTAHPGSPARRRVQRACEGQ